MPWSACASWKTREVDGITQSKFKGLRMEGPIVLSLSVSPKAWETAVLMSKGRKRGMFQLARESRFVLPPTFLFYSSPQGLDDHHFHWCPYTLLQLLIKMAITSRDTFTVIPRRKRRENRVLPTIWASQPSQADIK